jgi:hypothetical protein
VLPLIAVTFRGAEGAAFIEALLEAVETLEVPTALVAVTLKVYAEPASKLVETSHVVAGAVATQVAPVTAFPSLLNA